MAIAARPGTAGLDDPRYEQVQLLLTRGAVTTHAAVERHTRREVAVRTVAVDASPVDLEALEREAAVLARVGTHPHVQTLLELVQLRDGRPALVLERWGGRLDELVRDGGTDPAAAVATAITLAGALETVHRAGVVHCGVRPATIAVSALGQPLLGEFGSAVALSGSGASAAPGLVAVYETTAHTAPELLLGERPSPATDVYGLASTLYELLTGQPPHRAYAQESPAALSLRILAGTVAPIVADGVPLALSDLLLWALAVDPAQRPPSAAWLAEELGRIERQAGWPRTRPLVGDLSPAPARRHRGRHRSFGPTRP